MPGLSTAVTFNHVVLANGLRVHCVEQGADDGPAMLLLHGYADSWFSFSRMLPLLPEHLRIIVPDLRGHGDSDKPETGYGMDDFTSDTLHLMDALAISRAVVVGHSMGSFVARAVAERAPARVRGLVLIGTAVTAANDVVAALYGDVSHLTDPVDLGFIREFQTSMIRRPIPDAFIERVISQSAMVPARVWRDALGGLLAKPAPQPPLGCPTIVIGGGHDSVFARAEQEALTTMVPGLALHIADDLGHCPPWEDPAWVSGILARFQPRDGVAEA